MDAADGTFRHGFDHFGGGSSLLTSHRLGAASAPLIFAVRWRSYGC